jgi:hypothetical protein
MPPSNGWLVFGELNGQMIKASGPLGDIGPDVVRVEVRTVVTQRPRAGKPADYEARVPAPTVEGSQHVDEAILLGADPWWEVEMPIAAASGQFEPGWARGTAVALLVSTRGEIETRSWSRWIWLDGPADYRNAVRTAKTDGQAGVSAGAR